MTQQENSDDANSGLEVIASEMLGEDPKTEETESTEKEVSQKKTTPDTEETVQPEESVDGEKQEDLSDEELLIAEEEKEDKEGDKKIIEKHEEKKLDIHTLTINGEDQEFSTDELKKGYLRQQDYTRKTQEVADMNRLLKEKEVEIEKQKEQLNEKRANEVSIAKKFLKILTEKMRENAIYDDSEISYVTRDFEYDLRDAQESIAKEVETKVKQQLEVRNTYIANEVATFINNNPDYQPEDKQQALQAYIEPILKDSDIVVNSKLLQAFKEGYEGRQLKSKVTNARKSLKERKQKKPVAPYQKSTSSYQPDTESSYESLVNKAKKSGSRLDKEKALQSVFN